MILQSNKMKGDILVNNKKIRLLMVEKDLNQKKLAAKMNVTSQSINALIREDSNPTIKTVKKLAEVLECEVNEIV